MSLMYKLVGGTAPVYMSVSLRGYDDLKRDGRCNIVLTLKFIFEKKGI